MISSDLEVKPLYLLFDQVLQSQTPTAIEKLAQEYALHEHFQNDRDMLPTLHRRFQEQTEITEKKRWGLFCLQVLQNKDYKSIIKADEYIKLFIKEFSSVKELERYAPELSSLNAVKKNEYYAGQFTEALINSEDEKDLLNLILTHVWYTPTTLFLDSYSQKLLSFEKIPDRYINALTSLVEFYPKILEYPKYHKIVRNVSLKAESNEVGEQLCELVRAHDYQESQKRLIRPIEESNSFETTFDEALIMFKKDKFLQHHFDVIANDLLNFNLKLISECPLSEFARLQWTRDGQAPHLQALFNGLKSVEDFVKFKICQAVKQKSQINRIEFFIELSSYCLRLKDYGGSAAILLALESPEITKLKLDDIIKPVYRKKIKSLIKFLGFLNNHKTLRKVLTHYEKTSTPRTPIIAMYTKDLVFTHENNPDFRGLEINWDKVEMVGKILSKLYRIKKDAVYESGYKTDFIKLIKQCEQPSAAAASPPETPIETLKSTLKIKE